MESTQITIKGRGTAHNPANKWMPLQFEADGDALDWPHDERPAPATAYIHDSARTIIATNDSPDVGFTHSINAYRGCEHGCSYCFARNGHAYYGLSAGLDFETKIFVKMEAAKLLREALAAPRYVPVRLQMSGVTDCYQPIERKLRLTRQCLEVLAEFRNPVSIITKNHLVTRDVDLLADLATHNAAVVLMSITTLDAELGGKMEPRASSPARRLAAVETLANAGVPVGVMVAPIIPGLNDHEMPAILKAAASAGAQWAGMSMLRLAGDVAVVFQNWLERVLPERRDKILNRVRAMRGGRLNESAFGERMRGKGVMAEQVRDMFTVAKRRAGLDRPFPEISTASFRRPAGPQLSLFE